MRTAFPAISQIAMAAMLASRSTVGVPQVVENRGQAMPKGALRAVQGTRRERKARTRAATASLMDVQQHSMVLGHLHPRWLRQTINDMLELGVAPEALDIEAIRAMGPEAARLGVEACRG